MLHAGLDLRRKKVDVCLLSDQGEHLDQLVSPPDGDALRTLARRIGETHRQPGCAVIESMTGARFVHNTLEQAGWEVEIADAQKVKNLAPLACKTDKKLRRLAWGWVAAVLATGCGAAGTVAPEFKSGRQGARISDVRHGYSVALPAGWYRARRNLTPELVDPREILSVATYPLRYERWARCRISGCPTPALNGFRATDILLSIQERVHARTTTKDVAIDLDRREANPRAGPAVAPALESPGTPSKPLPRQAAASTCWW